MPFRRGGAWRDMAGRGGAEPLVVRLAAAAGAAFLGGLRVAFAPANGAIGNRHYCRVLLLPLYSYGSISSASRSVLIPASSSSLKFTPMGSALAGSEGKLFSFFRWFHECFVLLCKIER